MAISVTDAKFVKCWTVMYESPNKQGVMRSRVTDFCEDVEKFRKRLAKQGGKILRVDGPREVETFGISF